MWGEDFCRLAHEAHASHQNGLRRVLAAETGHFQRISHAAAGFFGQGLNHRITVIVGHQHCIAGLELGGDSGAVVGFFFGCQRLGLLGI